MDKYCYNGLLWLAQGEDVNIYDAESGDLLVEDFTLTERKDTIELPMGFQWITNSPYYFEHQNTGVQFGGRTYYKSNNIPCYGAAIYRSDGWTAVAYVALDPNGVVGGGNYGPTGSYGPIQYMGLDWYMSGPGSALYGDQRSSANVALEVSYPVDQNGASCTAASLALLQKIYES